MSFYFIPLFSLALSGLAPERIPGASGLFNFARITAGSFGTSITTTLWDRRATLHHAQLVERMTGSDPASSQALATLQAVPGTAAELRSVEPAVDSQAFMLSADDIFYVSGLLSWPDIRESGWLRSGEKWRRAGAAAAAHTDPFG